MKPIKNEKPEHSSLSNVDSITDVTSMVDRALAPDVKNSLFEMYPNKKLNCNRNLPIFKDREDVSSVLTSFKPSPNFQ